MFNITTAGIVGKALSVFAKSEKAKDLGLNSAVVDEVSNFLKTDTSFQKELEQQLSQELEKAREHDNKLTSKVSKYVNDVRGLIRPVSTVFIILWYVYAKIAGIELTTEDYSIIGGVLAFWFGFRSYEKKSGIF